MKNSRQSGVVLIIALVALVVLSMIGVSTIGEITQNSINVRNDELRQRVFFAAWSELNAIVDSVNKNPESQEDALVEALMKSPVGNNRYELDLGTGQFPILTENPNMKFERVKITARRSNHIGCNNESIGKVRAIRGVIEATARLNQGDASAPVRSRQRLRYSYCLP